MHRTAICSSVSSRWRIRSHSCWFSRWRRRVSMLITGVCVSVICSCRRLVQGSFGSFLVGFAHIGWWRCRWL